MSDAIRDDGYGMNDALAQRRAGNIEQPFTPRQPEPMLSPAFVTAQIRSEVDDLVRHYLKRGFTVEDIERVILDRLNSMDPHGKQVTA